MILKEIKYSPFSYKLKNPFQTSSGIISERKGFFVSALDELGNNSISECSPLPGFSSESYNEVEKFLSNELKRLLVNEIKSDLFKIKQIASEITKLPSVRFALEQALFGLVMQHDKNFIQNNFYAGKKTIPVNAVIGFDKPENILAKVEKKYIAGYRTFKIKVGRENFSDDYELVKLVREKFSNRITIRLDANGKWDIDSASDNLVKLSEFDIEYIEEPCRNLACLMKLAEHSKIPIAVDESLKTYENVEEVLKTPAIKFLVVKPMILGGIISAAQLIKEAEAYGKKIIISSAFETPIGKSALVFLASLASHNHAHGLDTANMFFNLPITDPYPVQNSHIVFDSENFPPHFDAGHLS